jgi:16S rRNA (cytosine967-C5)-methyltransferase
MPRRGLSGDARALAHAVLVRVGAEAAFADVLLADRLAAARLVVADRALVTRLVYGTLAWQGRLDYHLAGLLHGPLDRLDAPVRAALRLGLYQLLFLDRIPAYAAVDASVRIVRRGNPGAAGLVNAVLRRAATAGRNGLPLPDPHDDPIGRLAVEWSHPRWLVERWTEEMGEELPALLAADNERGRPTVRINRLRATATTLRAELGAEDVAVEPARWAPDALTLPRDAGRVRTLAAWREGRLAFQGEVSQLITQLLGLTPGARVLDVCAAPGGKATHAAALVGERGLVVALDLRPAGARQLREEAARLGAGAVQVAVADARHLPLAGTFDAVLVDAPCSGLGTLRRHPELRWRRRPDDIPRLALLQRELLASAARCVRPGGVLVYAVCTLTREENALVLEHFLAQHPGFRIEAATVAGVPAPLVTPAGTLRTLPHRHELDGFFAARLRLDSPAVLG